MLCEKIPNASHDEPGIVLMIYNLHLAEMLKIVAVLLT